MVYKIEINQSINCLCVQDVVEAMQRHYDEHHDFHEAQQECEKWLLQMSFRLMSHNSLNVSSMELTERQIEKHRVSGRCHCFFRFSEFRIEKKIIGKMKDDIILLAENTG